MNTHTLNALATNLRHRARQENRSILVSMTLMHIAEALEDAATDAMRHDASAEGELYNSYGGTD